MNKVILKKESMKDELKTYIKEELEKGEKMVKTYDCFHSDEPLLMREMLGYCKGIRWTLKHLTFFRELIDLERSRVECEICHGKGYTIDHHDPCSNCDGKGYIE